MGSSVPTGPPPSPEADHEDSDRPTAIPTFDVESFAKQQADGQDSERPTAIPAFDVESFAKNEGVNPPKSLPSGATDVDMLDLLAQGDAEGAGRACEQRLKLDPTDAVALQYEPAIRAAREATCIKTLGSLLRIPIIAISKAELCKLPLDHRTGFVLSLVDGVSNFDTVLAISGMPRFDALRALCDLLRLKAISVS